MLNDEDFMLWQATVAAQQRLGLPIDPAPGRDSQRRRSVVDTLHRKERTTGHVDVMGLYAAFSDTGVERLFIALDSDAEVTKSDVGKAHMVLLRIARGLKMNGCESTETSTKIAEALKLDRPAMARILPALVRAGAIKMDSRKRPAPIYVNPAIAYKGDGGKIKGVQREYDGLDFAKA